MDEVDNLTYEEKYDIIEILKKNNIKLSQNKDGVRCRMDRIPVGVKKDIIQYIKDAKENIPDEFKIQYHLFNA